MTSLFIAMLRSLNIPAKYVSGVSFTDSDLFDFNWGAHAWSEIYFPGHGWVPFDVTYGQYGFVDPSHMKLRSTLDSGEPSSYFQWYGHNVNVQSSMLDFDVNIIEKNPRTQKDIEIDITTRSAEVAFGSYNLIIATVNNLQNYYLPVTMTLSQTTHLELLDIPRQEILLRPGEERRMYWRVRVDSDLSRRHIYTFPIRLSSPSGHHAEETFLAKFDAMSFSKEDIDRALQSRLDRGSVPYTSYVNFICDFENHLGNNMYYPDDEIMLICEITNNGDLDLDNLEVCMYDVRTHCETMDILGRQSATIEFYPDNFGVGFRNIGLSLENRDVAIGDEIELHIRDYPSISIEDVILPETVSYGNAFNLSFILKGQSEPKNVNVTLSMNDLTRNWNFDRLSADREFHVSMHSRDLLPDDNRIILKISFADEKGKIYTVGRDFRVDLVDIPFFQNLFMRIRLWLESLIS